MKKIVKFSCYIEEYKDQSGKLCARLRDKQTNKKVVLTGRNIDKRHFLRFLAQARININLMPTVYDRDGSDIIAVRGYVTSNTIDEIEVCIDIENGGYLYE